MQGLEALCPPALPLAWIWWCCSCDRLQSITRRLERATTLGKVQRLDLFSMIAQTLSALFSRVTAGLKQLALLALVAVLSIGLVACDGGGSAKAAVLSPEALAAIERQADGFFLAKDRLPELATLVNARNWVFTRNLIHGPMQEVGREMSYINQRLLPADRPEAEKRAVALKTAFAQLDEAAKLQDGDKLRKAYIKVASGFGLYAQVLPAQVQEDLKQA